MTKNQPEGVSQQTLEEFGREMRYRLNSFISNWEENHRSEPEDWPNEMGEGEWFEQFLAYMTGDAQ